MSARFMLVTVAAALICSGAVSVADVPKPLKLDLGGGTEMELVGVPAGEFMMGSPDREKERQACETPVHRVKITKPFYMGKFEVTNAQYRRFRPGHRSRYLDGEDQPALWVSWHDADAFCRWLSKKASRAVRLPTEAEWEYACRAGSTTRFYTGDSIHNHMNSTDLPKAGWYGANAKGSSKPVGQLQPNAFGLYDMHGNAWEWCGDWYAADYYKKSPENDPNGPESGAAKILRGGCWFYWTTYYCRSAHRYRYRPDAREPVIGFRVVVETGPYKPRPAAKVTQPWPAKREIVPAYTPADGREREVAAKFGSPAVFVPRAPEAPRIDGRLDDAAWKRARGLRFRHLSGRAAPPTQPTIARVLCDGRNIYFAFDCADDDMKRLTVAGDKRDDPVWQGDTVEIFLDPQHSQQPDGYFHIAVNPAGVTMDTKGGSKEWNPALKLATSRSAGGWKAELALPLGELGTAEGEVPTVWGMNLTRYRPELAAGKPKLGTLVPHSWPVDEPDKLRFAEDTGWAATLSDTSHTPTRFGHALLEAGTRKTTPPERLFELIAREDFASGERGKFSKGTVVDGGYMGAGKALRLAEKEVTLFQVPLRNFRDVQLLIAFKSDSGGMYWHTFGKMYGTNKCCARQVTTLTRDPARLAPTVNYCDGAGRIDYTSSGMADPYYAGFRKHLSWFSEPTIGRIHFGGPKHWAVAYVRVGELQTQHPHNKRVDPDRDSIPGWFFHASGGGTVTIADAVMFRGLDCQPPEKVTGLKCRRAGSQTTLSWSPAKDNTLTVWYKVTAGTGKGRRTVAEVPSLSLKLPASLLERERVTVQAVDFFGNVSAPSDPAAIAK